MSHPCAKQMAFDLDQPSGATPINLTSHELLEILDEWVAAGWLRSIDRAVAGLVLNHAPKIPALALLALVLASHQAGQGHVCLDMNACLADAESVFRIPSSDGRGNDGQAAPRMTPADLLQGVDLADWQAALDACPGVVLQSPDLSISDSPVLGAPAPEHSNPPFVREGAQLYLRRYWQQEQGIVAALQSRLTPHDLPAEPIRQILDALFPSSIALGASARIDSVSAGSPRVQMQGATRREWPSPYARGATQQLGPWRPALTGLAGLSALGVTASRHAMSMASSRCLDCEQTRQPEVPSIRAEAP